MSYVNHGIHMTDTQARSLASGGTITLAHKHLIGEHKVALTATQIAALKRADSAQRGAKLQLSLAQLMHHAKMKDKTPFAHLVSELKGAAKSVARAGLKHVAPLAEKGYKAAEAKFKEGFTEAVKDLPYGLDTVAHKAYDWAEPHVKRGVQDLVGSLVTKVDNHLGSGLKGYKAFVMKEYHHMLDQVYKHYGPHMASDVHGSGLFQHLVTKGRGAMQQAAFVNNMAKGQLLNSIARQTLQDAVAPRSGNDFTRFFTDTVGPALKDQFTTPSKLLAMASAVSGLIPGAGEVLGPSLGAASAAAKLAGHGLKKRRGGSFRGGSFC